MVDGIRPKAFSLETEDRNTAIGKILSWKANPTLAEAEKWAAEVARYIKVKQADKTLSRHYASSRSYVLIDFGKTQGVQAPRQVTLGLLQGWYDGLLLKHGANTAKHYIVHMRVFLQYLVDERRVLGVNVGRQVKMVRTKQKAKNDFVERKGVRRLLAAARLETRRERMRSKGKELFYDLLRAREREFILFMGFDAGMRKNEISEARRVWFDLTHGHGVHISETPTYRPKDLEDRTVPLTGRFLRFLKREFPDGLPAPYVLKPDQVRGEKSLYRYDPRNGVRNFMERWEVLSVNGRRPNLHMMRHSFASNRLLNGSPLYLVAKWLGDDEDTTFKHYGHLMARDERINVGV